MDYSADLQIGISVTGLVRLVHRGIPLPDDWSYIPYTITYTRPDGIMVGDGYPVASWVWSEANLSQLQLDNILALFDSDTQASKAVVIRTPTERGKKAQPANFDCVMHRPVQGETKEMVTHSRSPAWAGVTLNFTRLEAA